MAYPTIAACRLLRFPLSVIFIEELSAAGGIRVFCRWFGALLGLVGGFLAVCGCLLMQKTGSTLCCRRALILRPAWVRTFLRMSMRVELTSFWVL
ncbi:hypothetical protein [Cerasicoccus maritimus]|uniref:hypothetical protein n=1 Tax=Cerasicoccus maritimus TaxID=490089 RepID=UPI002852B552|nr:hypothetical protein [Cerasicoccus maritimus]